MSRHQRQANCEPGPLQTENRAIREALAVVLGKTTEPFSKNYIVGKGSIDSLKRFRLKSCVTQKG
jgi:hypothetical protein